MPLFQQNFQPLSFEQANPYLMGMSLGQQMGGQVYQQQGQMLQNQGQGLANQFQNIKNQYAAPLAQQSLLANTIANQAAQAVLPTKGPMAYAALAAEQAQPSLTYAQANEANQRGNLFGTQANQLAQMTPYQVAQLKANVYDPNTPAGRINQLTLLQKSNPQAASILAGMGMGIPQGTTTDANGNIVPPSVQQSSPQGMPGVQNASPTGVPFSLNTPQVQTPQIPSVPGGFSYQSATPGQIANQSYQTAQGLPPPSSNFVPGGPISGQPPAIVGQPKFFQGSPLQNYIATGTPYGPVALAGATAEAKSAGEQGVTTLNDLQKSAAESADIGNQIQNYTTQFQQNYPKATFTGGVLGKVPVTGLESAVPKLLSGGKDLSADQLTDNASQNIAATVAKLIAGGRVTNYEMQYINNLKPNRAMDNGAQQVASDFLMQKAQRLQEQQQFINSAKTQGVDPQTINQLWGLYNIQRPVYDFRANQPNDNFQGSWKDYLNPQVISAAQNGQQPLVVPSSFKDKQQFLDWKSSLPANALQQYRALNPPQQGGQ